MLNGHPIVASTTWGFLQSVIENFELNFHQSLQDYQLSCNLIEGLYNIDDQHAEQILSSLASLLSLIKSEGKVEKCLDLMILFTKLFRNGGTPKISNQLTLSKISEILGNYFIIRSEMLKVDEFIQAMHMFTFACHCLGDDSVVFDQPTGTSSIDTQLLLYKKQLQVQALYICSQIGSCYDCRMNQVVKDMSMLQNLLGVMERIGDLLIIDFPSKSALLYKQIINLNKSIFSEEEKHILTSRIAQKLNVSSRSTSLFIKNTEIAFSHHLKSVKHRLTTKREELKAWDVDIISTTYCDIWSETMQDTLSFLFSDAMKKLGPAPSGSQWCAMVFGSLARREACPNSDIELCILYRDASTPSNDPFVYLRTLARVLELSIILVGESACPFRSTADNPLQLLKGGFQLDSNFNPSQNPLDMILSLSTALQNLDKLDQIEFNMFCSAEFIFGSKILFDEYKAKLSNEAYRLGISGESSHFNDGWKLILKDSCKEFVTISCERNWMKDHIRFITLILSQLSLIHGVFDASNVIRIDKLSKGKNPPLNPILGCVLDDIIRWMNEVRCKIHLFYGEEREDFVCDVNQQFVEASYGCYRLPLMDESCFLRYLSHIKPLLIRLLTSLYDGVSEGDTTSTFNTLSYLDTIVIAEYWVLRSDDIKLIVKSGISSDGSLKATMNPEIGSNKQQIEVNLLRSNLYFDYAVSTNFEIARSTFETVIRNDVTNVFDWKSLDGSTPTPSSSSLKKEKYGRSEVFKFEDICHIKMYPELPGIEFLASDLAHRLTGYTCSFSMVHVLPDSTTPILISKSVLGNNLHEVLQQYPKFMETHLDYECYSWHFIRTLMLSPEDDKPDNFIVYYCGNNQAEKKAKVVFVDNDHSFIPPVSRGVLYDELLVKSIIYCSDRMKEPIHPDVMEKIKSWDPEILIRQWMDSAIDRDRFHRSLLPSEVWFHSNPKTKDSKFCLPIQVDSNLAVNVFLKIKALQVLLSSYSELTHLDILQHIEYDLATKYYGRILLEKESWSTEQRFTALTEYLYKLVEVKLSNGNVESCRRSQVNTLKMLQSSLGKVPTEKEIKERKVFTARQMKECFEKVFPPDWITVAQTIQQEIIAGNLTNYWALPSERLREDLISGVWSPNGRSLITGFDFKALEQQRVDYSRVLNLLEQYSNSFLRLSLKNCSILTNDRLVRILRRSSQLIVLDIRGCVSLTSSVLTDIELLCPLLQQCLHKLDDGLANTDALATAYRMLNGDSSVTISEIIHAVRDEALSNSNRSMLLKLVSTRICNGDFGVDVDQFTLLLCSALENIGHTDDQSVVPERLMVPISSSLPIGNQTIIEAIHFCNNSLEDNLLLCFTIIVSLNKVINSYKWNNYSLAWQMFIQFIISAIKQFLAGHRENILSVDIEEDEIVLYHELLFLSSCLILKCDNEHDNIERWEIIQNTVKQLFSLSSCLQISNMSRSIITDVEYIIEKSDHKFDSYSIIWTKINDVFLNPFLKPCLTVYVHETKQSINSKIELSIRQRFKRINAYDKQTQFSTDWLFRKWNNKRNRFFKPTNRTLRDAVKLWIQDRLTAIQKYGHICTWNTSSVTDMKGLFRDAKDFNDPIGSWDVSCVVDMSYMFYNASQFNQSLITWDTHKVKTVYLMFYNTNMSHIQTLLLTNINDYNYINTYFIATNQTIRDAIKLWIKNKREAERKYGYILTWDTSQVTDMSKLFQDRESFNDPISTWNVSNVKSMSGMFYKAVSFNQCLHGWNTQSVTDMSHMFFGALSFNQSLDAWNISQVTDMSCMFRGAASFNQCLANWDLQHVAWKIDMFKDCYSMRHLLPNQSPFTATNDTLRIAIDKWFANLSDTLVEYGYIGTWDTSNVTNMKELFLNRIDFNDDITKWNVCQVVDMSYMFCGASSFDQPLQSWNVTNVIDMTGMFKNAYKFNQRLDLWSVRTNVAKVDMFKGATAYSYVLPGQSIFMATNETIRKAVDLWCSNRDKAIEEYGHISTWNTSLVTDMKELFVNKTDFNDDISSWNVSAVITMSDMFCRATAFNRPLSTWQVSSVYDMKNMFYNACSFNQSLCSWDVGQVTNMRKMFWGASSFNQPLDTWNPRNVDDMSSMFREATSFNQPLQSWNVRNVTNMSWMFCGACSFDQPILSWDVGKVTTMRYMFYGAIRFNQLLISWNVENVENMSSMFEEATKFNQPLNRWNIQKVYDMNKAFYRASSFNQDITMWNFQDNVNVESMFEGATKFQYMEDLKKQWPIIFKHVVLV